MTLENGVNCLTTDKVTSQIAEILFTLCRMKSASDFTSDK